MLRDESSCDGGSIVEKLESFVQGKDIPLFAPRGGGGGTPLYKLYYRYVPPQRVWFLSRFGLILTIMFLHRVWFSREP